ncbi:MAG TPA: PTS fructose transporter subunit IIA [Pseudoflavonifractor sp.]|nr:PTS fructose transporter subunit IIA [Pseudoflavonifractor sp.]
MRKILVATHGYLADGIKSSIKILTGKEDCITCINAYVDQRDYTPDIQAFMDAVGKEDEAVIFTDLQGGSVNQKVVTMRPEERGIYLVTGFNLTTVLGVVLSDGSLTPEIVDEIVESSAKQMLRLPVKQKPPQGLVTGSEAEAAFFG